MKARDFRHGSILVAILLLGATPCARASTLEIVSYGVGDIAADGASSTLTWRSISDDGRYVLFRSYANNLSNYSDTNNDVDIYLFDRVLGTTELISIDSMGNLGPGSSDYASMTPDARYVAFQTSNTYVLPDDNYASDVFVRDRLTGQTVRASVNSDGDGAEPLYATSGLPDISADGRYVVFSSEATNLVSNDNNGYPDVFLRDLALGTTTRVSVDSNGFEQVGESNSAHISADGRYVVFVSQATLAGNGLPGQIYVRDLLNQTTQVVSVSSSGDIANDVSSEARISDDGRYVFFESFATNLVTTAVTSVQIYRHDMLTGSTILVSTNSSGEAGDSFSQRAVPTADGRFVLFQSASTNLVAGDTNGKWDIFWRDCDSGLTRRLSVDAIGAQGLSDSEIPTVSGNGEYMAFESSSLNWLLRDGMYDPSGYNVFFAPISLFADGFDHN